MKIESLPPRIPASTVCKLAGYSKTTLRSRIRQGRMAQPIDRAREQIFITSDVLRHLGLSDQVDQSTMNPFEKALDAIGPA